MTGGFSSANVAVRDGALVVTGEIALGLAFPWAGVIWMPGEQPMQPVDFSGREVIRFRTRGDGREYSVMLISRAEPGRAAAHRDVCRARGVDPGGDPAGGLPDGHAGSHCGVDVCGGGGGWGVRGG